MLIRPIAGIKSLHYCQPMYVPVSSESVAPTEKSADIQADVVLTKVRHRVRQKITHTREKILMLQMITSIADNIFGDHFKKSIKLIISFCN